MKINKLMIRTFDDREKRSRVYWEKLKSAVRLVLADAGIENSEINLIACSDKTLAQLKADYFHVKQFTDVIAFPLEQHERYLEGEIYFSPQRIRENAQRYETSYTEELQRVIIHGTLHLLGHRDQEPPEKEAMNRLEDYYLEQIRKAKEQ